MTLANYFCEVRAGSLAEGKTALRNTLCEPPAKKHCKVPARSLAEAKTALIKTFCRRRRIILFDIPAGSLDEGKTTLRNTFSRPQAKNGAAQPTQLSLIAQRPHRKPRLEEALVLRLDHLQVLEQLIVQGRGTVQAVAA